MNGNENQAYTNDNIALRAEYEEEARVFGWMKKSFLFLAPAFAVLYAVMFIANIPALEAKYGAEGIANLILYLPAILISCIPAILWAGCIPSGYIWAYRAIRRSRLFVMGNFAFLAVLVVLLIGIPILLAPVVFIIQWRKVSRLKSMRG